MRSEQEVREVLYWLRVQRGWSDDGETENALAWALEEPQAADPKAFDSNEDEGMCCGG